jgi:hypothetical protein|tara:strand:- start:124 stop:1137 length:1014 start_codon:yes stop_codon:yes gene_type:complete
MKVNNIFDLVNKFSKEEDQISAAFGFILSYSPKILNKFLCKLNIRLTKKELKNVDIETQVTYESGESIIDLQLTTYDNFLIFLESKLYKNEKHIVIQLRKYAKVLNSIKDQYKGKVRLVYVNKFPITDDKLERIRSQLRLKNAEFYFLSWETLIQVVEEFSNKEIIKLFRNYIGDTMYSKRIINEQKIKDVVEVLIIHTNEENWDLIDKKKIAVQGNGTPDAKYIAFYRTQRKDSKGKKIRQAITHIAEVVSTQTNVKRSEIIKGVPKLKTWYESTNRDLNGTHKHYNLGEIIELAKEIPFIKGKKSIGQVKFKTKMSELLRVTNISELKKLSHFKK